MKRSPLPIAIALVTLLSQPLARAGEIDHYAPGLMGTRDFFLPDNPGFIFADYNMGYSSNAYFDAGGNRLQSVDLSGSVDITKNFSGSQSFSLMAAKNTSDIITFYGDQLNLAALLNTRTTAVADLTLGVQATATIRAQALLNAHLDHISVANDAFFPAVAWILDTKILGARYAIFAGVPMVYMDLDAQLSGTATIMAQVNGQATINAMAHATITTTANGTLVITGPNGGTVGPIGKTATFTESKSLSASKTIPFSAQASVTKSFQVDVHSHGFALGDGVLMPIWLDWKGKYYDIAFLEAVDAPTGRYHTGALDNTGLGFWTNQTQLAAAYYPLGNPATAIAVVGTYEINGTQIGTDIRPGDHFTLNWGLSQYLPLNKAQTWLVDVGPIGYDSWQTTDDTGGGVTYNPSVHDYVHAWGIQLGVVSVTKKAALTVRWIHEYAALDRFKGGSLAVNFAIQF